MHPTRSKSNTIKKIRVTPPLFEERIKKDLELSRTIIELLDEEKEIENNYLLNTENGENAFTENPQVQLDLQILYLRRVHGFCYYCIKESEDERNLATKCDNIHLRNYKILGKKSELKENPDYRKDIEYDSLFTQKINEFIEFIRSRKVANELLMKTEGGKELENLRLNYCQDKIIKHNSERFECSFCNKMFKGDNYVKAHIINRHMPIIYEEVDKNYYRKVKKENYLNDPNKPFETGKIINRREEYLSNLVNGNKKYNEDSNKGKSYYDRHSGNYRERRGSRDYKEYREKKKYKSFKEFNDWDDPEKNKKTYNIINFDDL